MACLRIAIKYMRGWILCRRLELEQGTVSGRVALLLRSAEVKPMLRRFVQLDWTSLIFFLNHSKDFRAGQFDSALALGVETSEAINSEYIHSFFIMIRLIRPGQYKTLRQRIQRLQSHISDCRAAQPSTLFLRSSGVRLARVSESDKRFHKNGKWFEFNYNK